MGDRLLLELFLLLSSLVLLLSLLLVLLLDELLVFLRRFGFCSLFSLWDFSVGLLPRRPSTVDFFSFLAGFSKGISSSTSSTS